MKFDYEPVVETGAGLAINYGATAMVGDNLRWNGWKAGDPADADSIYKDRRLIGGVVALGIASFMGGMPGQIAEVVGQGALHSVVTTETLRARLLKPAAAAPAPASLPPGSATEKETVIGACQVV